MNATPVLNSTFDAKDALLHGPPPPNQNPEKSVTGEASDVLPGGRAKTSIPFTAATQDGSHQGNESRPRMFRYAWQAQKGLIPSNPDAMPPPLPLDQAHHSSSNVEPLLPTGIHQSRNTVKQVEGDVVVHQIARPQADPDAAPPKPSLFFPPASKQFSNPSPDENFQKPPVIDLAAKSTDATAIQPSLPKKRHHPDDERQTEEARVDKRRKRLIGAGNQEASDQVETHTRHMFDTSLDDSRQNTRPALPHRRDVGLPDAETRDDLVHEDAANLQQYMKKHADEFQSRKKYWSTCNSDTWLAGADGIMETFSGIFDRLIVNFETETDAFLHLEKVFDVHKTQVLDKRDAALHEAKATILAGAGQLVAVEPAVRSK